MFLPGIGALQLVLVLPKPSPMLVLDTFLPGIGASRVKHHVTRKDACALS